MMRTKIFTLFFLLLRFNFFAQEISELPKSHLDSMLLLHYRNAEYAKTLPYIEEHLKRAEVAGNDTTKASMLGNKAVMFEKMEKLQESTALHKEAILIKKRLYGEADPMYAQALYNFGALYQKMAQYDKAKELYIQAVLINKNTYGEDHPQYAAALTFLSRLYAIIGEDKKSERTTLKTLKIYKKAYGEEHESYVGALNSLAVFYYQHNRYEEAETFYLQCLELNKKLRGVHHPEYATTLNNLAYLYQEMALFKKAEPMFLKSLAIRQKFYGKEHSQYITALNNLAIFYYKQKRFAEAEVTYKQTIALQKKTMGIEHPSYAKYINNLAVLYQKTDRFAEAEALHLETLKIRETFFGKQHSQYVTSLNNLVDLYALMGPDYYDKALDYTLEALNVYAQQTLTKQDLSNLVPFEFKLTAGAALTMNALNKLYKYKYEETKDIEFLKNRFNGLSAYAVFTQKRQMEMSKKSDKLRLLKKSSEISYVGIQTAEELFELTSEMAFLEATIGFAEYNKSAILSSTLHSENALSFGDVPDSLIRQGEVIKKELSRLEKALIHAKANKNDNEIKNLQKEIIATNLEQNDFKKKLHEEYPKYAALKYQVNTVQSKILQEKILDQKTAILEYFIYDTTAYLILITKAKINCYPLSFTKGELSERIGELRKGLSNYTYITQEKKEAYGTFTRMAHYFYEKLLFPALKDLEGIESLVIIPDNELGHIPFEVLLTELPQQEEESGYESLKYLIHNYRISYSYSASLLLENKKSSPNNNGQILGFASHYPQLSKKELSKLLDYQVQLRKHLKELPAAHDEVLSLEEVLPKGQYFYATDANEANFKEYAKNYAVLHLAMHGVLSKKDPLLSALVFSEDGDTLEDNFLEAHEISHLKLNNSLVVLSACETGYGKFEQGEGVMSLARSFMYAGVPSMVVSLWQVNDQSTAVIMKEFYNNLLNGMTKDEALRQAKLFFIKDSRGLIAHPVFWSAFIHIGESSPIYLGQTNWYWWGTGLLGGLLLVVFFGRKLLTKETA